MIRVVVADDNPVTRLGLRSQLGLSDDIVVVGEAADGEATLREVAEREPDVLILDVRMPRLDGNEVLGRLDTDRVGVLVMTNCDDPAVICTAIQRGARGYLVYPPSDPSEIEQATRKVAVGEHMFGRHAVAWLTSLVPPEVGGRPRPGGGARTGSAGHPLSVREAEVMELVGRGHTNKEVAAALFISEKTVKNHLNRIFRRIGATNRVQAISHWQRNGNR